jgi:hypothetical protein
MLRTFDETTQRQNAENAKLRKQLLAYQNKEEQLHARVQELDELTDTLVETAGRNPPDKTASTFTPRAAIPSSPLGLTPRVPRPQDVAYQAALKQQQAEQTKEAANLTEELKSETGILKLFSKLAQALTDNNNVDVSSPPHFSGKDDEWETWYSQFRTYLKAKGWLDTFESQGPHTGFWDVLPFWLTGRKADLVLGVGVSSVFVFHPRPLPVADREPFPLLLPPRPLPLGGGPRPLPLRLSFLP